MKENCETLGIIFGTRDFFPEHLVTKAREDISLLLQEFNVNAIMLDGDEAKRGAVETYNHAKICADLFSIHRNEIIGILIVLPNFGDEKSIADTIKLSGLKVPILVQAYPDDLAAFNVELRRDAFCGKISVCNNLRQYGYPFTITKQHTSHPLSDSFKIDFNNFLGICRVVKGMRNVRLGAIGARPNAFNTVRYSEKLLEEAGITVLTLDLSVLLGEAAKIRDNDILIEEQLHKIKNYLPMNNVPSSAILRMAKLSYLLDRWIEENDIQATAIQCWDAIQKYYGINVCTLMSMMSEQFIPSACEVDVTGALSMYALQLATNRPSALVDWNNNYCDDPNKCVLFHCGNWAKSFYKNASIEYANILATTLGKENTYGAINGRIPGGKMSYARISSDDKYGVIKSYVGDGDFTDDPLNTFGSRAVVNIPDLQLLLKYIVNNGFEHHVAISAAQSADILEEAFSNYLGWDNYRHVSW